MIAIFRAEVPVLDGGPGCAVLSDRILSDESDSGSHCQL